MRCGGCGAEAVATWRQRALARLHPTARADVLIGLTHPDDAAVVAVPADKVMVHTVDFFRAIVDDPYVFGKIAANHSLGDIFAMGAEAQSALAIATVPYGVETVVEDLLAQMLLGAEEVLHEAGAALVGGHSSEGAELALGFAINGLVAPQDCLRKSGMHPGDRLIVTKALGTGTLFAADMRQRAKGRWMTAAIASMLQSNRAWGAVSARLPGNGLYRRHGLRAAGAPGRNDPGLRRGCHPGSRPDPLARRSARDGQRGAAQFAAAAECAPASGHS